LTDFDKPDAIRFKKPVILPLKPENKSLFIDKEMIVDNIKISLVDKIKTKEEKKRD
jgi:hypothetical protein